MLLFFEYVQCENLFKNRFNAVNSNTLFCKAEQILQRKVFLPLAIAMMVYVPFIVASTSLG